MAVHGAPAASLSAIAAEAAGCRNCPLWASATQTVFGEGPVPSEVMLVGEQPGDREDQSGHVFVGPAGAVLDEALEEIGLNRDSVYITNVVKHFKWTPRGKRRIHQRPNESEISACRPWLDDELRLVHPRLLVCLGATAAQALLGRSFRVTRERGRRVESERAAELAEVVTATVHPSSILRAGDEDRSQARRAFVADLRAAVALLDGGR